MNFMVKKGMSKQKRKSHFRFCLLPLRASVIIICSVFTISLCADAIYAEEVSVTAQAQIEKTKVKNFLEVNPLDLVHNPNNFINKNIKMHVCFHKFSTLGLDYDKAMRNSKDFISILIKRPDVPEKYTIPLSEMKIIIKRDQAEDLLEMESGDKVEITGKVFSSVLNDPWIEVYELNSLEPKKVDDEDVEKKTVNN